MPLSLVMSANTSPPLASEGAVLKNKPLSSAVVKAGEVADGEIIGTPFGTATFERTAPVTPEQSAPIIAVTPCEIKNSAADAAAAESIHVESALIELTVEPPNNAPEFEASLKANSAPAAIPGVNDSIGPVKPKIMPTLTSLAYDVLNINKASRVVMNLIISFPLIN